jgi:SprB repeat
MKKILTHLVLGLLMAFAMPGLASAATYITVANGSWTSGSTWAGGSAPNTDVDGHTIVIQHDVTVVNHDIKLMNGATLTATGITFTMQNGNFTVENGSASFTGCNVEVAHGFSIQITTSQGALSMIGCQVHVGQNFQNSEGERYLEDVCLIVDESFQNAKGTDTLINVCALIGAVTSGNFQNDSDSDMYIEASEFHLPNGNFQNQSNANLSGTISALWLENGDLQNSGNWTASIAAYCVSGQVTVASSYLPGAQTCSTIAAFFNPCSCSSSNPDPLAVTLVATHPVCHGDLSGAIDATVAGGTAPFSFAWSNGSATEDLAGLAAGTYSVTVTDANGGTATATITLTQPSAVLAACAATDVSCFGNADGAASVSVSGGTAPYALLWSTGQTGASVSGLAAGSYSVVATDANGCAATCTATVTEPSALSLDCRSTDVTCHGANDGSATVTPLGGTPAYTYLWSNGSTASTISGLGAGTYSVTVTDANGCTAVRSFTIAESPALSVACSATNATCNGAGDGSASVAASGGTPAYSYLWSNGATTATNAGLVAGAYAVTVTDALGCQAACSVSVGVAAGDTCSVDPGDFRTQTQGGWGSTCNGGNPGCYRDANFAAAFPNGLTIGCNNTLTLTTSAAVENYLPCGGPASVLSGTFTDPNCLNNVLSAQLIAATLSVTFDAYDANFGASTTALGSLVVASGPMAGLTVNQVLLEANLAIGGCGSTYSLNALNQTLTSINENFVDGTMAETALECPVGPCSQVFRNPNASRISGWPNPFDGAVNVTFVQAVEGETTVEILGIDGARKVRSESLGIMAPGTHVYTWDGTDHQNTFTSAGVYLVRIATGDAIQTVKVIKY